MGNREGPLLIEGHRMLRTERGTHLWVDKGDKTLLKSYKQLLKCTVTAAVHHLIGLGSRCHEEKHVEQIAFLEERGRGQARIILAYLEKYGPLRKKE
ncbi:hypothetical protein ACFLUO_10025 [Chloroflexota bacterium]